MAALLACCAAPGVHAARLAPRRPSAAGSAADGRFVRCHSVPLRARKPDAADFARAQAAVDALLHAAAGDASSDADAGEASPGAASELDARIAEVSALGAELNLDRVGPATWNCGTFNGHALQGRLRRVLSSTKLTLPALSFGLFDAPPGHVTLMPGAPSRIIKGASGRSRLPRGAARRGKLDADSRADRYAVQTPFILHREGGRPPLRGVNTVVGNFCVEWADGAPRDLAVQFTRVQLSLTSDNGDGADDDEAAALLGVRERALPAPARAVLRVLLMTPTVAVTRSDLGSVAVLTRCDAA